MVLQHFLSFVIAFFVIRCIDAKAAGSWPPSNDVIKQAAEILRTDCGDACVEVMLRLDLRCAPARANAVVDVGENCQTQRCRELHRD